MTGLTFKLRNSKICGCLFHTTVYCLQKELAGCERVLDLGCGLSSPLQYCLNVKYSVGVEAYYPYLNKSQKKKIHSKYLHGELKEINFPKKSFDAVIMIEVLEHMDKEEGMMILRRAETWAKKKIIVSTPNGYFPMGEVDNNPWQRHLSGWSIEDFQKLGFKCRGLAGMKFFYCRENQVVSLSSPEKDNFLVNMRWRPKILFFIINSFLQVISYYFPPLSFELLAVKKIGNV